MRITRGNLSPTDANTELHVWGFQPTPKTSTMLAYIEPLKLGLYMVEHRLGVSPSNPGALVGLHSE